MLRRERHLRMPTAIAVAIGIAAVGLSLTSCGGGGRQSASSASVAADDSSVGAIPAYNTSRMSIATAKPIDAYVMLGGRIKTCWFNPSEPLFPEHVYRADVSPSGEKVKIVIHRKKDNLGRAGQSAYAIDFAQQGTHTVVTTENRLMTPEQAAKMQFDINRWKGGETSCSKEWPKVAAQQPAE